MLIGAALYPLSYLALSLCGYYQPLYFGLGVTSDGRNILRPKFGYTWTVPGGDSLSRSGSSRAVRTLYAPLLWLDRRLWHTMERAETMRYPIRNYYDRDLEDYRDHNP